MFSRIILLILVVVFINPNVIVKTNHQILKTESIIHLKFFNKYLTINEEYNDQEIRFRVISGKNSNKNDENITIFVLNDHQNKFVKQELTGHPYKSDEFVLINIKVNANDLDTQPNIIEYYMKDSSQNWNVFANSFLSPFEKTATDGQIVSPIIDRKTNAIIGKIDVKYLLIRPISNFNAESDHIISIKSDAIMGHRGTGVGRRTDLKLRSGSLGVLENTIEAFNYACDHGADMIELDIQLSKDKIPIIHHDFVAKVLLREKTGEDLESINIPVQDITYSQMQKISVAENKDFDYTDNQPFETLKEVLTRVRPECGINFEIKYPQKYSDGTWNGMKGLELNEYIDLIVKTLYEHIGNRSGIITSFEADLCVMLHLKQNRFKVALITSGDVRHWNPKAKTYDDPRTWNVPFNTYFAQGFQLNGLSIIATDLMSNRSLIQLVKSRNQSVIIWGDQLDNYPLLESFLKDGADALCINNVDKIVGHQTDTTELTDANNSANHSYEYISAIIMSVMSMITSFII